MPTIYITAHKGILRGLTKSTGHTSGGAHWAQALGTGGIRVSHRVLSDRGELGSPRFFDDAVCKDAVWRNVAFVTFAW